MYMKHTTTIWSINAVLKTYIPDHRWSLVGSYGDDEHSILTHNAMNR